MTVMTRWAPAVALALVLALAGCGDAPVGAYEIYDDGQDHHAVQMAQVCVETATGIRVADTLCPTDDDLAEPAGVLAPYAFYYFASTVLVPPVGGHTSGGLKVRPPSVSTYRAPVAGRPPAAAPDRKVPPPQPARVVPPVQVKPVAPPARQAPPSRR